jgi:hypothetical protein
MFSQGDPVLAGVDLDSSYLFGLEHQKNRGQDDWADFLNKTFQQNMNLKIAIKDAAPRIATGVAKIFPNAGQRDDCFHVVYELNKVGSRLERQAYAAIQAKVYSNKKLVKALSFSEGLELATTDLMGRLEALNKIYTPMIVLLACLIWQALGKLETTKIARGF